MLPYTYTYVHIYSLLNRNGSVLCFIVCGFWFLALCWAANMLAIFIAQAYIIIYICIYVHTYIWFFFDFVFCFHKIFSMLFAACLTHGWPAAIFTRSSLHFVYKNALLRKNKHAPRQHKQTNKQITMWKRDRQPVWVRDGVRGSRGALAAVADRP